MKLNPLQQAGSVFRVAVTSAASAVTGNPVVAPQSMELRRLETCNACPRLQNGTTCGACGCNVKFKAKVVAADCPLGLWK